MLNLPVQKCSQKCSTVYAKATVDTEMISYKSLAYKEIKNGANGIRTHDLLHAMQALSQLSYGPEVRLY